MVIQLVALRWNYNNMDENDKQNKISNKKIRVRLFDKVISEESKKNKKVDLQVLFLDLFDDIIEDRAKDLTPEQVGKLVRLRAKIEIELNDL